MTQVADPVAPVPWEERLARWDRVIAMVTVGVLSIPAIMLAGVAWYFRGDTIHDVPSAIVSIGNDGRLDVEGRIVGNPSTSRASGYLVGVGKLGDEEGRTMRAFCDQYVELGYVAVARSASGELTVGYRPKGGRRERILNEDVAFYLANPAFDPVNAR